MLFFLICSAVGFRTVEMVSFEMNDRKNPILVRGDVDDRIEIYHAILHETPKLQGHILIWLGLRLGPYRMAHLGDDTRVIRFHCAVQWLLAYIGSFPTKDTNPWLDLPTALCDIVLGQVQGPKSACVRLLIFAEAMGIRRTLAV
ncbi:hypothetical protein Sjap_004765 [Stephania japonica]|uniref:Uncharacterized protein n=1 Tax=Stephania japonica TaxID=461633 RepID=A0AAP0PI39_9MAGN